MASTEYVEQVYAYIWRSITEQETLPYQYQIAEALGIRRGIVSGCVYALRKQGQLSETNLLPTAYPLWWRENVRREQRWKMKPLVPLRRLQERQLKLPLMVK